jgi:dihydrofolate reductase
MAKVVATLSMSLDGFIAHPDDTVDHLFDWYENGDVDVPWPGNEMVSHVTPASATYLRDAIAAAGALVVGRRLFDITHGWEGHHPFGVPVFVVTHSVPDGWPRDDAPFAFVTDGVEQAVARASAVAGDRNVGVAGPNVIQQVLDARLLDELTIELVPVVLGEGIRFFDHLTDPPMLFDNPTIIAGDRVTHLTYRRSTPTG